MILDVDDLVKSGKLWLSIGALFKGAPSSGLGFASETYLQLGLVGLFF